MSEPTEAPEGLAGLPEQGPISGIPAPTPAEPEGHAEVEASPAEEQEPRAEETPAPAEAAEPAFFDRKEWEESLSKIENPDTVAHLRGLEKMLQGQWTKKTQALAQDRNKVEAYNAFMEGVERDPHGTIQALQQQLGLTPAQANAVVQEASGQKEYSDWSEVFSDIKAEVMAEVRREMAPAMANVHKLTTQQVEAQFDAIDPDWRLYEDNIMSNMSKHPTLVRDIHELYRLSVPAEVQEQRAVKEALARFESQKRASAPAAPAPSRSKGSQIQVKSFDDAVRKSKMDLGM